MKKSISAQSIICTAVGLGAAATVLYEFLAKRPRLNLRGKVVLITGGSRGLGLVLAREFAAQGARLAICARDGAELRGAEKDLTERGAEVLTVRCDVTDHSAVEATVEAVIQRFGQIDVLVNNAGVIQAGPAEEMTREDFEQGLNTHFWGPFNCITAVLPLMKARKFGRIVNIASIGGKVAVPHLLPYCASKFALVGLSRGMRAELMQFGIAVTTVCPGLMRTGSPRNAQFKGQNQLEYALFSISDSLPGLTVSAENAARQIVDACPDGRAELIISVPAKVAALMDAAFPELTAAAMSLVNQLLPGPGGVGKKNVTGEQSESWASPSFLTSLTDAAAMRNNEM